MLKPALTWLECKNTPIHIIPMPWCTAGFIFSENIQSCVPLSSECPPCSRLWEFSSDQDRNNPYFHGAGHHLEKTDRHCISPNKSSLYNCGTRSKEKTQGPVRTLNRLASRTGQRRALQESGGFRM